MKLRCIIDKTILRFRDYGTATDIVKVLNMLSLIILLLTWVIFSLLVSLYWLLLTPVMFFIIYLYISANQEVEDKYSFWDVQIYEDLYELRREHEKLIKRYNDAAKLKYAKVL